MRHSLQNQTYGSGQSIVVGVDCNVINPKGTERTVSKNISVNVLDEDDNAPSTNGPSIVQINLERNYVTKVNFIMCVRQFGNMED